MRVGSTRCLTPVLVLVSIFFFSLLVASFTRLSVTHSGEHIEPSSRYSAERESRHAIHKSPSLSVPLQSPPPPSLVALQ
jgi:hypothetical protein